MIVEKLLFYQQAKVNPFQVRDKLGIDNIYWIEEDVNKEVAQIHEIDLKKETGVSYLYTERVRANNLDKLKIIGLNEKNEVVWEVNQLNDPEKQFIGFKLDDSKKIRKIKFYTVDNNKAFVKDKIFLGIKSN